MLSAILSGSWVSLCVMEASLLVFPLHCSLRKDICCCRLSLKEGGNRSLDFPCHIGAEGGTTVLQAVTRFSAACTLVSAVLWHDGLLHYCRLRKIPQRHSER
jgi:hypothetical protein